MTVGALVLAAAVTAGTMMITANFGAGSEPVVIGNGQAPSGDVPPASFGGATGGQPAVVAQGDQVAGGTVNPVLHVFAHPWTALSLPNGEW